MNSDLASSQIVAPKSCFKPAAVIIAQIKRASGGMVHLACRKPVASRLRKLLTLLTMSVLLVGAGCSSTNSPVAEHNQRMETLHQSNRVEYEIERNRGYQKPIDQHLLQDSRKR
ncbi:MAG: hypothetical protein HY043_17795 [Verrucomicrobia bacterium]|nr:hypothetical protein [Verrucomicrobiota bacterium]